LFGLARRGRRGNNAFEVTMNHRERAAGQVAETVGEVAVEALHKGIEMCIRDRDDTEGKIKNKSRVNYPTLRQRKAEG